MKLLLCLRTQAYHPDATDYDVEHSHETKIALEPSLVHTLSHTATPTSIDGKYLATLSTTGILQIFDVKSGKRFR